MKDYTDSPFSWAIAVFSSLNVAIYCGFLKSGGVVAVGLNQTMDINRSETSMISLLAFGFLFFFGTIGGLISHKIDFRPIIMVGGFLAALGLFISAFVTDSKYLYITLGFIQGSGYGLMMVPNFIINQFYFKKHRGKAFGINLAGGPIGSFIFPPIVQMFIKMYGIKGTFLIMSAITLNVIPFSILLKKPKNVSTAENEVKNPQQTLLKMTLSLLTNKYFYLAICSILSSNTLFMTINTTLPDYGIMNGATLKQGALLISIYSAVDIFSRFGTGFIIDLNIFSISFMYGLSLLICGGSQLISGLFGNVGYGILAISAILFGLGFGSCTALFPMIVEEFMGDEYLSLYLTFVNICSFILALSSSSLINHFLVNFGTYSGVYIVLFSIISFLSLIWFIVWCISKKICNN